MPIRLRPAIICFSSPIGAGKSTLATSLADSFDWPHTSFGDYVRRIARERDLQQSRDVLQRIGEELVSTSLEPFTRAVVSRVTWQQGCVIDGLRHMQVLRTIRQIVSPLPVFVVFIDVDEAVRRKRLRERGVSDHDIDAADQHETEAQVRTAIRKQADLHLNGQTEIPLLIKQIREFLEVHNQ